MGLFNKERLDHLKSDLMKNPNNVNHGALIDSVIRACEDELTSIVMNNPNDQNLGELLRTIFKGRKIEIKTSAMAIQEMVHMLDNSELLNYLGLKDEDPDDVVSMQIMAEATMAPVLTIIFRK